MSRYLVLPILFSVACAGGEAQPDAAMVPTKPVGCTPGDLNFVTADADEFANALAAQFAGAGGVQRWVQDNDRKPAVRFRTLRSDTMERIDLAVISVPLQKAMLATGGVEILAEASPGPDSEEQRGADLVGALHLSSIDDLVEGRAVRLYKVSVRLTEAANGSVVWIGDHEIQKMCDR